MRLPHLVLVSVLYLGLIACSPAERAEPEQAPESDSQVIQPGRPGEPNKTVDPGTVVEEPGTNDSDVAFMQMMIPHHAQALEMSDLARTRARDEQVVAMARRIEGAQGPEIVAMSEWLRTRDLEVPESMDDAMGMGDHEGHGSGHSHSDGTTMHGMLSDRQMRALADARGRRFDRLFVTGMIQHHEGAVAMAGEEAQTGSDTLALELATEIAAGQVAEIQRLVDIRAQL